MMAPPLNWDWIQGLGWAALVWVGVLLGQAIVAGAADDDDPR